MVTLELVGLRTSFLEWGKRGQGGPQGIFPRDRSCAHLPTVNFKGIERKCSGRISFKGEEQVYLVQKAPGTKKKGGTTRENSKKNTDTLVKKSLTFLNRREGVNPVGKAW